MHITPEPTPLPPPLPDLPQNSDVATSVTDLSRTSASITTTSPDPQVRPRKDTSQVRPWARYFARITDLSLLGIFTGLLLEVMVPEFSQAVSEGLMRILMGVFFIFVETALMTTIGTTPGKWLLNITVLSASGKPLDMTQALNRSLGVWLVGFGLFLPIISFFTLIYGYVRLHRKGITSWDERGGYQVWHAPMGAVRVTLTVLFFAFLALLMVLGS